MRRALPAVRAFTRRGTILVQTLVMSVVISMMAVMLMRWVLSRYILASRVHNSAVAQTRAEGCAGHLISSWNAQLTPTAGPCTGMDPAGKTGTGIQTVTVELSE